MRAHLLAAFAIVVLSIPVVGCNDQLCDIANCTTDAATA